MAIHLMAVSFGIVLDFVCLVPKFYANNKFIINFNSIAEIVTSSPIGIQLSPLHFHGGIFYRNVTWYPSQHQVGQQLFGFKAVDSKG